jgi:hypothetical protein
VSLGQAASDDACFDPTPVAGTVARVAIGFFGLSRNLSLTMRSIQRHVFDHLHRNGIQFDVFWSTMVTSSFSNSRTKEKSVEIKLRDYELVKPCAYTISNQDNIKDKLYMEFRKHTSHDPWRDDFMCLKNVLCSYYSQSRLSDMIDEHIEKYGIHYDAILVLRPDTAVISDIDLPQYLIKKKKINGSVNMLWVPDFHSYLGYNDRSAFGSPKAVFTYLRRGSFYMNASFGFDPSEGTICHDPNGVHRNTGECFLKLYLDNFGVAVSPSSMRLLRTRVNGVIPSHDNERAINLKGNAKAIADYKRCVSVVTDKSVMNRRGKKTQLITLLNYEEC